MYPLARRKERSILSFAAIFVGSNLYKTVDEFKTALLVSQKAAGDL